MSGKFIRYWLPVIAWFGVIFVASTDLMSAQHTSRFLGPFLRWLSPDISLETIRAVQFAVRKAAHVMEYGILSFLLFRALQSGTARMVWRNAAITFVVAAAYAALDEYHQSFVASRTGAPLDVLIDVAGAALGILIYRWFLLRGRRVDGRTDDAGAAWCE